MTRDEIRQEMEAAGLTLPKVVPFLKRDGARTFDLYAGHYGATKKVRISADCDDDALTAAIESLK